MTAQQSHSIASGKPYLVTGLLAGSAASLDQFLGDTEFTIDGVDGPVLVCGHGVTLGEIVRFHEKSAAGGGKDVRVWHVCQKDDFFIAESIGAY
ncbi:hypothetical protein [Modestobacter caceresii]|nr:hypothetical protein [Modestobacter caceresii]